MSKNTGSQYPTAPISAPQTGGKTVTTTPHTHSPMPIAPGTGGVVVGQPTPAAPFGNRVPGATSVPR